LSAEAEGSPLLEAVAKERLVKTQQAGKGLAGAVVICEILSLAVAPIVRSRVYKLANNSNIQSETPSRVPQIVTALSLMDCRRGLDR
jgi:hypothetical protein